MKFATKGASVEVRRKKGSTSSVVYDATFPKGEGYHTPTSCLLLFTSYLFLLPSPHRSERRSSASAKGYALQHAGCRGSVAAARY